MLLPPGRAELEAAGGESAVGGRAGGGDSVHDLSQLAQGEWLHHLID